MPGATEAPAGSASVRADAGFRAFGSIGQATVVDADEGDQLVLLDADGAKVAKGTADRFGSYVFYAVDPGKGYTVRHRHRRGRRRELSALRRCCRATDVPDQDLYESQEFEPGLNYIHMRDGVELAMTVRLPQGKTLADGPFPTVVEYSGYPVAGPNDLLTSIAATLHRSRREGRSARTLDRDGGRVDRHPAARLRDGQRADPRQRLLGRCVRPLRAPDHLRRLRRHRDRRRPALGQGWEGRHGRHLLLGLQPAVRRRHPAAPPRGRRAHVAHRRPVRGHRVPRRHLQHRVRGVVADRAHRGRQARTRGRPAVGQDARRAGRRALHREPAAPRPGPGRPEDPRRAPSTAIRSCSAIAPRASGPSGSTCRCSSSGACRTSSSAATGCR